MRRVIITHVGTTALSCEAMKQQGYMRIPKNHSDHMEDTFPERASFAYKQDFVRRDATYFNDACQKLEHGLQVVWSDTSRNREKKGRDSNAEINSLQYLNVQPHDRIVLVCTNTYTGLLCGMVLRHCLQKVTADSVDPNAVFRPNNLDIDIHVLEGVDAVRADDFARLGLLSYIQLITSEVYDKQADEPKLTSNDELVFNVTGGYKGVIPFAVIAAQLIGSHPRRKVRAEVSYVYEEGNKPLVTLTPFLPIDWNKLRTDMPGIRTLVTRSGTKEAIDVPDTFSAYRQPTDRSQPNMLAQVVYHVWTDLNWK